MILLGITFFSFFLFVRFIAAGTLCKPEMDKCRKLFIQRQWKMAIDDVALGSQFQDNNRWKGFSNYIMTNRPNIQIYNTTVGNIIAVGAILKVGSEGLLMNLRRCCQHILTIKSQSDLTVYLSRVPHTSFSVEVFSVVRDPLTRFYSSMTEIFQRTFAYGQSYNYSLVDMNRFPIEAYLHAFLLGTVQTDFRGFNRSIPVMFQHAHISLMSNIFFGFNITIIKHLETFGADWELLRQKYTLPAFDTRVGTHPSTAIHHPSQPTEDDSFHVHSKLKELFSTKPRYLKAVCRLLLIDYVCFPEYALPSQCQQLNQTLIDTMKMLKSCESIPQVRSPQKSNM